MSHLAWVELKRDRTHFTLSSTCFNLNLLFFLFSQEILEKWSDNHTLRCTAPPKGINVRHCIFFSLKAFDQLVVVVVQSLSCVQLSATPWTAAHQASPSFTISRSLLKFMSIESIMPSISSSAIPFSSCLQSFPASVYFPTSQLFTSGGQTIGDSASPQSFQWIFRTDFL